MPKQKTEVDITQRIELNADQVETIIHRHLPQIVTMYQTEIRGLLPQSMEVVESGE